MKTKLIVVGILLLSLLVVGCSSDYTESWEYKKGYQLGYNDLRNEVYDTCNKITNESSGNWISYGDLIILNNNSGCFVLIYDEDGKLKNSEDKP